MGKFLDLSGLKKVFNIVKSYVDKSHMVETTWADLKNLRDNGKLIPGQKYRITDYECTTTQEDTQSAGHQFDIIVTADSESVLNEEAGAIQHEGDTYFANSNLKAWKLWYSLDNDTSRFEWADATNGKGVVYRMIDEWQNDCPYDFKNILFNFDTKEYPSYYQSEAAGTGFVWRRISNSQYSNQTISSTDITTAPTEAGLYAKTTVTREALSGVYTFNAVIGSNVDASVNANVMNGAICENNSIGKTASLSNSAISFEIPKNTFVIFPMTDTDNYYRLLIIGNSLSLMSDGNVFLHGSIGNKTCTVSQFTDNYFAGYSLFNTFGNYCYSNTFGNNCKFNTFGNDCDYNTFGNNCKFNTFGNDCDYNTFGNNCDYNTFGNNCKSNTFGNNCKSNTFGNNCDSNTFGNNCDYNTFGNNCDYNTFVSSNASNTTNAYFNYTKFEANVQNIKLINSTSSYVKYYHIKAGVTGEFTCEADRNYETIIAKNSKGVVVEYCEADLISVPLTGISINGNDTITANGTYNYTVVTTPAYPTDVKSTVWSLGAGSMGTIDSSTGVLTIKNAQGNGASALTTIKVEVTTDSGQVFSATKDVNITIQ